MSVNCVSLLHTFTPEGKELFYKAESDVSWSICSDLKSLSVFGLFFSIFLLLTIFIVMEMTFFCLCWNDQISSVSHSPSLSI